MQNQMTNAFIKAVMQSNVSNESPVFQQVYKTLKIVDRPKRGWTANLSPKTTWMLTQEGIFA